MAGRGRPDWMWAEAWELLEHAERLHSRFFELALGAQRPTWEPPVDLYETAGGIWLLLVALPGVDPSRIEVQVDARTVTVAGERSLPAELHGGAIHRLEIPHGRFARRIELPQGRFTIERQSLVHGCLVLGLRRLA